MRTVAATREREEADPARAIRIGPIVEAMAEPVEHLLDLAFGYDRRQRTAYRLRDGVPAYPPASFAAFDGAGRLVGSLQSWPLALAGQDGEETPLWLVGPIAVRPDRRGEGIARAMIARALSALDATGIAAVLIGDPGYYGAFGFSAEATGGWQVPGPVERHRLLARGMPGRSLPARGLLGPRR